MTRIAGIIVPIITFFSHAEDPIATTTDSAVVAAQILWVIITVVAVLALLAQPVAAEGVAVDGDRRVLEAGGAAVGEGRLERILGAGGEGGR